MQTREKYPLLFIPLLLVGLFVSLGSFLSTAFLFDPTVARSTASYIIRGRDVNKVASVVQKYNGTVTSRMEFLGGVCATLPLSAINDIGHEEGIDWLIPNTLIQGN